MSDIERQDKWLKQLEYVLELRRKLKEASAEIECDAGYFLQSDYDKLQREEVELFVLFKRLITPTVNFSDIVTRRNR